MKQIAMILSACALAIASVGCVTRPPALQTPKMPAVDYRYSAPRDGIEQRLTITTLGEIQVASSQHGLATGKLTDEQIDLLRTVFQGWDRLPDTYPAEPDGEIHVLSYGGKSVTGGSLSGAPLTFQAAVAALRYVTESLPWQR